MAKKSCFLRGLYELCSGDNQQRMCASLFGREQSQHNSRAFKYFIEFMNDNYLVKDSLPLCHRNGFSKASADAVWDKMLSCGYNPTEADLLTLKRFGPAQDGVNAARWDVDANRAFYNGWKSVHGLRHQTGCQVHCIYHKYNTCFLCMAHLACILPSIYALKGGNSAIFVLLVDNAFGITVDICGPTSLRRSDLHLLRESAINSRLSQLQDGADEQICIFGDSAYPRISHPRPFPLILQCYEETPHLHQMELRNNGRHVQVPRDARKLRLMRSSTTVSKIYTVCTILKNCHAILYGNQTSNYFNVSLPDGLIDYYINQEDLP